MMSSGTSTETSTFSPWHFFTLAALVGATIGVLFIEQTSLAGLILLSLTIGAGALVGLGLYRTLRPLTDSVLIEVTEMVGDRTRAAVEREKTLVLRSIKELEFDRAMGKVSESDFSEMSSRLRARAINLMKQLDIPTPSHRDLIEKELDFRLSDLKAASSFEERNEQVLGIDVDAPGDDTFSKGVCAECGTSNGPDAHFCKRCGEKIIASVVTGKR